MEGISRFAWVVVVWIACLSPVRADSTERRDFTIFVDGKEVGRTTMSVVEKNDGQAYMKINVQVKVRILIVDYEYTLEAEEWWKAGKLVGLKSSCNDNGKRIAVQVASDGEGLSVRVNDSVRNTSPDTWTTSYWKLADSKFHNKPISVLETDRGKDVSGKLEYVGTEQLTVAGEPTKCFHFRVSGTDLWFDQYHRLVRQELTELGHKTIVMLTATKRGR
ncbi:MAG: hypothetical protein K2X38_23550 [Gemmataceae bacterium]|nr:hypothetical protein [Gemmataceae bacterium]